MGCGKSSPVVLPSPAAPPGNDAGASADGAQENPTPAATMANGTTPTAAEETPPNDASTNKKPSTETNGEAKAPTPESVAEEVAENTAKAVIEKATDEVATTTAENRDAVEEISGAKSTSVEARNANANVESVPPVEEPDTT